MGNKKSIVKNTLTENQIDVLINTTDYKREQIINLFENFDKLYPNGNINRDQFCSLYKQIFPHKSINKEYTDLIFSAFDTDKSEIVNFEEFLIGICLSSSNNLRKKLRLAFRIYDSNNNGRLDRLEIERILNSLKTFYGETEINNVNLFNNGSLSEDQFIDFILDNPSFKQYLIDLFKTYE